MNCPLNIGNAVVTSGFIIIKRIFFFSSCVSVRQMEQNVIDLAKIEEETREKIANVNSQKVSVVAEFMAQMKVRSDHWGSCV